VSWSLDSVSFRMSGSGSWQYLLPDEASRRLYTGIYPNGASWPKQDRQQRQLLASWQKAAIVRSDGQKAVPLGPLMTDHDLDILKPWFRDISDAMCAAVQERLPEYQTLAMRLAGRTSGARQEVENILTIQICAHTLDSGVFSLLRQELIGTYPPRDFAGNFFFWGYAFAFGPKRIFGFTTYGIRRRIRLHVIRSHGLDREPLKTLLRRSETLDYLLDLGPGERAGQEEASTRSGKIVDSLRKAEILEPNDPPRLAIPVFTDREMEPAVKLYEAVSSQVVSRFMARMDELKGLVSRCSFARCSWPDTLCMLFHLAYSYATDQLVEKGTIPEFPGSAGGEWGVWMH